MAGLVRPRSYPIRSVTDNKQDAGMIYNPVRYSMHGGFSSSDKYPKGDAGFRAIDTPTSIKTAEVSRKTSDD